VVVAGVFAALLIADANAPEKIPEVRESVVRPLAGPVEKHRKEKEKTSKQKRVSHQDAAEAATVADVVDQAETPVPASADEPSSPTRPAPDSDADLGGSNPGGPSGTPDSKPVSDPEEPTTPTPEPEPEPEPDPDPPVVNPCVPVIGGPSC
jgi:hypothetical protein